MLRSPVPTPVDYVHLPLRLSSRTQVAAFWFPVQLRCCLPCYLPRSVTLLLRYTLPPWFRSPVAPAPLRVIALPRLTLPGWFAGSTRSVLRALQDPPFWFTPRLTQFALAAFPLFAQLPALPHLTPCYPGLHLPVCPRSPVSQFCSVHARRLPQPCALPALAHFAQRIYGCWLARPALLRLALRLPFPAPVAFPVRCLPGCPVYFPVARSAPHVMPAARTPSCLPLPTLPVAQFSCLGSRYFTFTPPCPCNPAALALVAPGYHLRSPFAGCPPCLPRITDPVTLPRPTPPYLLHVLPCLPLLPQLPRSPRSCPVAPPVVAALVAQFICAPFAYIYPGTPVAFQFSYLRCPVYPVPFCNLLPQLVYFTHGFCAPQIFVCCLYPLPRFCLTQYPSSSFGGLTYRFTAPVHPGSAPPCLGYPSYVRCARSCFAHLCRSSLRALPRLFWRAFTRLRARAPARCLARLAAHLAFTVPPVLPPYPLPRSCTFPVAAPYLAVQLQIAVRPGPVVTCSSLPGLVLYFTRYPFTPYPARLRAVAVVVCSSFYFGYVYSSFYIYTLRVVHLVTFILPFVGLVVSCCCYCGWLLRCLTFCCYPVPVILQFAFTVVTHTRFTVG